MAQLPEVKRLLRDVDLVLEKYSNSDDPKVKKVVRRFKRSRDKLDAYEGFNLTIKIIWLADKIHEYLNQLP